MNNVVLKYLKGWLLIISVGLFLLSFTCECYCTTALCNDSIFVFLMGPLGFWLSLTGIVWFANPLLIMSWLIFKSSPRISLITSVCASALSLSFLLFNQIIDNESGDMRRIISYKSGYWLWVSSTLCMSIGNVYFMKINYFRKLVDLLVK